MPLYSHPRGSDYFLTQKPQQKPWQLIVLFKISANTQLNQSLREGKEGVGLERADWLREQRSPMIEWRVKSVPYNLVVLQMKRRTTRKGGEGIR